MTIVRNGNIYINDLAGTYMIKTTTFSVDLSFVLESITSDRKKTEVSCETQYVETPGLRIQEGFLASSRSIHLKGGGARPNSRFQQMEATILLAPFVEGCIPQQRARDPSYNRRGKLGIRSR